MRLLSIVFAILASSRLWAAAPMEVKTTFPSRGDVIRFVSLPGALKPNQQATLYAKVGGYLKNITVDKGDPVKAGQIIAEIEVPELIADLARARAETNVANVELSRLEAAAKQSPDLITPLALDSTRGRAEVARATQTRAETLLSFAHVAAPFAGVVTARFVDPGAYIPAASTGSTPQSAAIVTIADFQTLRATVAMPEAEASRTMIGQPVRITVDGLTATLDAKVSRIAYALDDATRTMLVEADLPNPGHALRPGQYAIIKVGVEQHADVLVIPVEALVMEKTNAFVYIAVEGKAKKTPIKIGFNDGTRVEVVSGLGPTAAVILGGKIPLTDSQPINPINTK